MTLAGAQDQSIFVFNRDYLDLDVEEVMGVLGVREGEGLIPSLLQGENFTSHSLYALTCPKRTQYHPSIPPKSSKITFPAQTNINPTSLQSSNRSTTNMKLFS